MLFKRRVRNCIVSLAERKYLVSEVLDRELQNCPNESSVMRRYLTIAEGTDRDERIGERITLKNIHIRYNFNLIHTSGATVVSPYRNVRMIWFVWHVDTAVQVPVAGDILQVTTAGNESIISEFVRDPSKRKKFTVVKEIRHHIGPKQVFRIAGASVDYPDEVLAPRDIYLHSKSKIHYTNTAGTTGMNLIYELIFADIDIHIDQNPKWSMRYRFNYLDV